MIKKKTTEKTLKRKMPTYVGIFNDIVSLKSVDFRRDLMFNPPL